MRSPASRRSWPIYEWVFISFFEHKWLTQTVQANNKAREAKSKDLKKEFQDVKASNKRLNNAVKAASEGNAILKTTLEKVEGSFEESKESNAPAE